MLAFKPGEAPPGRLPEKERLGVFGGTFDPIHLAHLSAARAARAAHSLSRVLLLPAANPPHKRGEALADPRHRLAMARIAVASQPGLEASDLEIARGGISFTADTLSELRRARPAAELFFIIGEDTIPELPLWKDSPRIFEMARIVAVNRPGPRRKFEPSLFPLVPEAVLERCERDRVEMDPADIASRDIRRAIREGKPFDRLLPPGVGEYIRQNGLYGFRPAGAPPQDMERNRRPRT